MESQILHNMKAKEYIQTMRKMAESQPNPKDRVNQVKFWDFILENGRQFNEVVDSKLKEDLARQITVDETKACYANAQRVLVFVSQKYSYYEGHAISPVGLPVEHGWNVFRGKVIDLNPLYKNCRDYFGIKIPFWFVKNHIGKNFIWGSLKIQYIRKKLFRKV